MHDKFVEAHSKAAKHDGIKAMCAKSFSAESIAEVNCLISEANQPVAAPVVEEVVEVAAVVEEKHEEVVEEAEVEVAAKEEVTENAPEVKEGEEETKVE